jgi:hypothetical protein
MNASSPRVSPQPTDGSWLFALGLSLIASLTLLTPFFWLGSASGHDFEFHVASWLDVAYQWHHGVLYPRWTFWTNHGFGEPRYIFYPPLSWMLGAFLSLVVPISWVPAGFILLTQTLAGVSAFFLLRRLASPTAAYLAAVFYAANPYALLVSYIRSDFAEQLAGAFFPLLLLAALYLAGLLGDEQPRLSDIARFAVAFAAIWLCNAPAGVLASYAMALFFAYAALSQRSFRPAIRAAAGFGLGFGLTAFYLIPAAYEQRWVNIAQALSSGLLPAQNFLFTSVDDVEHTWFNWISSICALILIVLIGCTALASRKLARTTPCSPRRLWTALLLLGAAATVLMLRFSLPFWNLLPKLRFVQFPWRWMSVLAVICCCFVAAASERRRGWLWLAFYLIFEVPLGIFLAQNTWWDPDEMSTQQAAISSGTGYEGVDEYDPVGDDHLDLPKNTPLAAVVSGCSDDAPQCRIDAKIQVQSWEPETKKISVQSSGPALIALRLLNYPAWQATVNGRPVSLERPDDVSQMLVPVQAGSSEIQIRLVRTSDRSMGIAVSVFSLLAVLFHLLQRWAGP